MNENLCDIYSYPSSRQSRVHNQSPPYDKTNWREDKSIFLVKADSGAKYPAKKAVLAMLRQQSASAMYSGAQQNAEKIAILHSILNPSAATMNKLPTARLAEQCRYDMQGRLLRNSAPTALILPR
jgi:hypothetical protein